MPDLLEACAQTKGAIIELDQLTSADVAGLDALLRLGQQGARLAGLPEYLRLTIETLARARMLMGAGHLERAGEPDVIDTISSAPRHRAAAARQSNLL